MVRRFMTKLVSGDGRMHIESRLMRESLQNRGVLSKTESEHDLHIFPDAAITPIAISVPPFHFWEPPPLEGAVPMHGSDFGLFQLAEVLGMKQLIFVKDEDGLYDKDPKKHADARHIPKIALADLIKNPP